MIEGEDMVWIIALSLLLAVTIAIILITVFRAKKHETAYRGTTRQNYEYCNQEELDCCKNCDYSQVKEDNSIWCTERNHYVLPDTKCPNYRGLINIMAKQIVKWELEKESNDLR